MNIRIVDRMFDFLKSKQFHIVFNFIVGLFIILVLRPTCKGDNCIEHKNPVISELTSSTYQLGSKCYQFNTTTTTVENKK